MILAFHATRLRFRLSNKSIDMERPKSLLDKVVSPNSDPVTITTGFGHDAGIGSLCVDPRPTVSDHTAK
jgi:hypothetical protein